MTNLQLIGTFPFTVSRSNISAPKFSIPLCLWSIFFQVFNVCTTILATKTLLLPLLTSNIGNVVFVLSFGCFLFSVPLVLSIMLVRSRKLVSALVDISTNLRENECDENNNLYNRKFKFILILYTSLSIFDVWYLVVICDMNTVISLVCVYVNMNCFFWSLVIIHDLSQKSFSQLSDQVVIAAEATVESWMSLHYSSFTKLSRNPVNELSVSETELRTLTVSLHQLECKISHVSHLKESTDILLQSHVNFSSPFSLCL